MLVVLTQMPLLSILSAVLDKMEPLYSIFSAVLDKMEPPFTPSCLQCLLYLHKPLLSTSCQQCNITCYHSLAPLFFLS